MSGGVLIISERQLVAEAIASCMGSAARPAVIVGDPDEVPAGPAKAVIVDLEAPGAASVVLDELAGLTPRRLGVYDHFTAEKATLAFELGLTRLVATTSPVALLDAALSDSGDIASATASVGLTGRQLRALASLSARELEVLGHIARGRSATVIATLLGITSHTVQTHTRRAFRKLQVSSAAEAVALATTAGVLDVDRES